MVEMGLQTFYEQPELHVSYAWRLGDVWKDAALHNTDLLAVQRQRIEWKGALESTNGDDAVGESLQYTWTVASIGRVSPHVWWK